VPRISEAARSERRQRFIDAAWRCSARKGYRDLTVDDVCIEARLSKGAFYGYFASKQDLLLALLEEDAGAVDELMEDLDRSATDSRERLQRFTRGMLARGDDPAHVQVRADLWNAMIGAPPLRDRLAHAIDRRRAVLQRWIEEGTSAGELVDIPPKALASLLLALGDGLLLHGALQTDAFRWPRIRAAVDILLQGISLPATSAPEEDRPDGVRP
jgi:AcrR family transcriptional regulator